MCLGLRHRIVIEFEEIPYADSTLEPDGIFDLIKDVLILDASNPHVQISVYTARMCGEFKLASQEQFTVDLDEPAQLESNP